MSLLEDIAHEYLTVDRELLDADGPRAGELAIHSLALRHDLNLLCDVRCDCDEGTCPGLITRPTWLLLDCGHFAHPVEQLRPGDEKWCATHMQWRLLAAASGETAP